MRCKIIDIQTKTTKPLCPMTVILKNIELLLYDVQFVI